MFLDIAATMRCNGGQIAIFVKKMHFSGRKISSKSSFYTKMFSDPKYTFSVCKK